MTEISMPDRTWESVAERLGISPDAGWPDVMHALMDRIDDAAAPAAAPKRASKSKQEPDES